MVHTDPCIKKQDTHIPGLLGKMPISGYTRPALMSNILSLPTTEKKPGECRRCTSYGG